MSVNYPLPHPHTFYAGITTIGLAVILSAAVGCGSGDADVGSEFSESTLRAQPIGTLLNSAIEQMDEVKFCLSEGADARTVQRPISQFRSVAKAIPASVASSQLSDDEKQELQATIDKLANLCDELPTRMTQNQNDLNRLQGEIAGPLGKIKEIAGNMN